MVDSFGLITLYKSRSTKVANQNVEEMTSLAMAQFLLEFEILTSETKAQIQLFMRYNIRGSFVRAQCPFERARLESTTLSFKQYFF